jgi:hypothetical protein
VEEAIIARVMETLVGADCAGEAATVLLRQIEDEFRPDGPLERLAAQHLAIVHVQLLQVRAMWAGAKELEDIERLTRLQNRVAGEFARLVGMLLALRTQARPVIAHANIALAEQQVVAQHFAPIELGSKSA